MATVYITTLALLVRSVGATFAHTFVNLDSEPCQRFVDIVLGPRHKPLGVSILDTEYHIAAITAGKQIVI